MSIRAALVPERGELNLPYLVRHAIGAWNGWNIAVESGLEITAPRWPFDVAMGRRFSDLPNPFEPLLFLWGTGYQLVCPFTERDPTIRLYAGMIGER